MASTISRTARALFYLCGAAALAYFTYTAIDGRFVLLHALLAVLALLITRLIQVWYATIARSD